MTDVIDAAMAEGAYHSIPACLLQAARDNPHMDWNATMQHVLTWRQVHVGNRTYSTCLVGIPLSGQLGEAFAPIKTVQGILKETVQKNLISKEDGLIFLDAPLPRSTVQMLDIADLYNLSSRLFERGVRQNPDPVLDAKLLETEIDRVDEAIMIGLLYWRTERGRPKILTDKFAQQAAANIVRQHLVFDRATPFRPNPFVRVSPMAAFFDATRDSSEQIIEKHLGRLMATTSYVPVSAEFDITMPDEILGQYTIEVRLLGNNQAGEYTMRLTLDSLRDGDTADVLHFLIQKLADHGITSIRTQYLATNAPEPSDEALPATAYEMTLH